MSVYEDWEEVTFRSQSHLNDGSGYVPWGTGLVEGAKDLAGRAVNQLQEWAEEDPDTWTDDALRLMGRGAQGAGRVMGDWERRSEEGEIGLRSAAGTALRFMNWSSEKGADLGGAAIGALGGNEDLGRFIGSFLPEAIGTKGLSKAAQVARSAKQIQRLNKAGYAIDVGRAAVGGGFGAAPITKAGRALKMSGKQHKALRQVAKGADDDALTLIYKSDAAEALKPGAGASTRATVTSELGDRQVYDKFRSRKDVKLTIPKELGGNIGTLTRIEGIPSKNFHHIFMKELAAEYVDTARRIGANADEVIELDRIAKRYGFGLGNYESAGYYADKIPHNLAHDTLIAAGKQPTGNALVAAKAAIREHSDIKALYKSFEKSIKELAVPLRDEVGLFQEAWDTIPPKDRMKLFKLRWEREALNKTQSGSKAHKIAKEVYAKHKGNLLEQVFERRLNQRRLAENVKELQYDDILEEAYRLGLDKLPPEETQKALTKAVEHLTL